MLSCDIAQIHLPSPIFEFVSSRKNRNNNNHNSPLSTTTNLPRAPTNSNMVMLIRIIGLSILAPSLSQIDTLPQRIRKGSNGSIQRYSTKTTNEDELFGRTKTNNVRANLKATDSRSLEQHLVLSMSIPSVTLAEMSIPTSAGGGDNPASTLDWPTYSPLPSPNLDEFDVDEVVSWICRFCPSTICSSCPSTSSR